MPIVKSMAPDVDGRVRVVGLASDHSQDLDGESIQASGNPDCLSYGFVKFDLNHNSVRGGPCIGDVESMRFLPHEIAKSKYPHLKIVGDPLEIEGFIYAADPSDPFLTDDLKTAHHYAHIARKDQMKLGFSIFGVPMPGARTMIDKAGRSVPVRMPKTITSIAITPQPMNSNSECYIVKSLHGALQGELSAGDLASHEPGLLDANTPDMVYTGEVELPLIKDLSASADVVSMSADGQGASGGDALKTVGLGDNAKLHRADAGRECPHCTCDVAGSARYCPMCGGTLPQSPDTPARKKARVVVKALCKGISDDAALTRRDLMRAQVRDGLRSLR